MVHISSEMVQVQNRWVKIGDSMWQFLQALGIGDGGWPRGGCPTFRTQMEALAACCLSIGMTTGGQDDSGRRQADPAVRDVAAQRWRPANPLAGVPGVVERVQRAAPAPRGSVGRPGVVGAEHSALALDVYTWLAH